MKKSILAALAIAMIAFCTTTINAQTFKPDWTTKVVLAGGGNDITNTTTLLAPTVGAPLSLTLPATAGGLNFVMTTNGSGVMSWTNLSSLGITSIVGTAPIVANTVAGTTTISLTQGNLTTTTPAISIGGSGTTVGANITVNLATGSLTSPVSSISLVGTGLLVGSGITADLNLGHSNTWTSLQTFSNGLSAASPVTLSSFATAGVIHNAAGGLLSSGPIALGSNGLGGDVTGVVLPINGGTGIANANANTITLGGPVSTGGSLTLTGAFATTLNVTGATNVTLPTTGTLLSSGGGFTTDGIIYATSATAIGSTGAGNAGQVLTSNGAGVAPTFQAAGGTITLSPSTTNVLVAGNNNNFAVNGTNSVYYLQNNTSSNVNLTGLVAQSPDRVIVLVNNSTGAGASSITLKDKAATSTDVNQFHLQGASDILLGFDGTVTLIYDSGATNSNGATGAWRVISAQ